MQLKFRNSLMIAGLAGFLVTGCSSEGESEPTPPPPESSATGQLSPESLVMAETAWLSVSADGAVYTTYLDPDGRYRDTRDGAIVYAGKWEQNTSGQLCFAPDAGQGVCWDHKAPGLDGVLRATHPDGHAIELKRIAYTPPDEPEEVIEDSSESESSEG